MHFRLHRSITKEAVATVRALLTMGPCTFENVQSEYVTASQRQGILDERLPSPRQDSGVGVLATRGLGGRLAGAASEITDLSLDVIENKGHISHSHDPIGGTRDSGLTVRAPLQSSSRPL